MSLVKSIGRLFPKNTSLFVCDVQEAFAKHINSWDSVISVSNTMIRSAKELSIPIFVTEQNPDKLKGTVKELILDVNHKKFSKMEFSMFPKFQEFLKERKQEEEKIKSVLLVGIESHVCVLQTTLDLLENGYDVHIIADGVSSQRVGDRKMAFERMRQSGAFITTSESAIFELMRTAKHENFKAISSIFKETRPNPNL